MKNKNKQTKFPVARIKKIMQKDEEVGKVAQATPIVISKALELFLALIIEKSTAVTTERGSKRVEAYHLKHAVENTEMLDFLKELVQDVPDPSAGGTIDLEAENADRKKRGKGKRSAAAAAASAGAGGSTTKPDDPDAPAPPKRKRRKKKEILEAAAAAAADGPGSSDVNKMVEDGHGGAGTEAEDHDYDGPAVPQTRRMFDEDASMRDDPDEYDDDESLKPPATGTSTSVSYRPSTPDRDYED